MVLEDFERVLREMPPLEVMSDGRKDYGNRTDVRNWRFSNNEQTAPKAVERILNCSAPLFVITGHPGDGRKRLALTLAQIALENNLVDMVAANITTDKYEKIFSIEKLNEWLISNLGKRKLFILAGAERHFDKNNKLSAMNKKFLNIAKLAAETKNHIFLISSEYLTAPDDFDGWRIPSGVLDDRLIMVTPYDRSEWEYSPLFGGWIDTPRTIKSSYRYVEVVENQAAFYTEEAAHGADGLDPNDVRQGFVRDLPSLTVQFSEKDPGLFYEVEPRVKPPSDPTVPSDHSVPSIYIREFIKADGAHTKAASSMGLGADVYRRRLIEDLKKALNLG
jgi:hypothetical protein